MSYTTSSDKRDLKGPLLHPS